MREVKADNKGRLTGAQPSKKYEVREAPDGTITYTPAEPTEFDSTHDITSEQFEAVFGVTPDSFSADDDVMTVFLRDNDGKYLPRGLVVTYFVRDAAGNRVISGNHHVKQRKLIRILK